MKFGYKIVEDYVNIPFACNKKIVIFGLKMNVKRIFITLIILYVQGNIYDDMAL
jgi:hypothetical protein